MRKFLNQKTCQSFALFIDAIYSKVRVISIVVSGIFLVVALYLYTKLPNRIPIHWNIRGQIDNLGSKDIIFIIPLSLLLCSFLSAKKLLQSRDISPVKLLVNEVIFLFVLLALVISICYVYRIYFSLI